MTTTNTKSEKIKKTEARLEEMAIWAGKLTLSDAKTKGKLVPPSTVRINGDKLEVVWKIRYLDVILDNQCKFREYVKSIAWSVTPMFQRVRRVVAMTWGLRFHVLHKIYLGVFVPRTVYEASVWGHVANHSKTTLLLLKEQINVLLAETRVYYITSTDSLPVLAGVISLDLEVEKWSQLEKK